MGWKFWKNDDRPQDTVPPAAPRVQDDVPFQLRVEDVFTITGRGTVTTGRVLAGVVRVNDQVGIQRGGVEVLRTIVDGVEMFKRTTDRAVAGDNVGLVLRGVEKSDVQQGDVLTS